MGSEPTETSQGAEPREVLSAGEERFDRARRGVGFWLAPLSFVVIYCLTVGKLTPEATLLCAILAAVLVLWVTESVPLPVTALLAACLCVVLGVAEAKVVLAPFADPIVFLFIGSFIIAEAMRLHKLDRRVALAVLGWRWVGGRPVRLLMAVGLVSAGLSMWVSNTATTAMMLPIAVGLLSGMKGLQQNGRAAGRFSTGVMLMVAYAASVGGVGTPVGSPPNLIGLGQLRKLAGVEISFFQWMAVAMPLLVVMFVVLSLLMLRLHPAPAVSEEAVGALSEWLAREREALGPWTKAQVNTLVSFVVAVVLWIGPGLLGLALGQDHPTVKLFSDRLPEAIVALFAAGLLFVLPIDVKERRFTMEWSDAVRIDWGTILLFGGGLTLGSLLFKTGVAEIMGRSATQLLGANTLWGLTGAAIAVAIVLSEATSNTAAATMIAPVVIALSQSAGIDPVPPTLGACLGASYGFMLPVSTPPNAIVYGSGLVPIPAMIRAGAVFDVLGLVIIWCGLRVMCPVMGWG